MLAHHRKDSCKKTDMKTMKSKPAKDSRGSMIFFQPEIRNRNKKPLTQTLIWFDYSKNSIILHAKKIQASKQASSTRKLHNPSKKYSMKQHHQE
jgi:hypothetical protein